MNEITAINTQELDDAIAKVETVQTLITVKTDHANAEYKKNASLELSKIAKLLDSKRQDAVKPALEEQRRINSFFKPVIDKLDHISRLLIKQVNEYVQEVERLERERKALEAKAQADALLEGKPVETRPEPIRPVSPNVTIPKTKVWTYEIVDDLLVPKQYLSVDTTKVSNAIKGGVRSIPGIKIYEEERIVRR